MFGPFVSKLEFSIQGRSQRDLFNLSDVKTKTRKKEKQTKRQRQGTFNDAWPWNAKTKILIPEEIP